MNLRGLNGPIAALALFVLSPTTSAAFDPAENDAFYLGTGSANIEVRGSDDLISGTNTLGGVRIGLFSTVFIELGYGTVGYLDKVDIGGVKKDVEFRTTGPHAGLGLLIPIRNIRLGAKFHVSPGNKWSEEITDSDTGVTDSRTSGNIDFQSYFAFVQLLKWLEVGVRRDVISETDSVLTNSFGPYIMLNIGLN